MNILSTKKAGKKLSFFFLFSSKEAGFEKLTGRKGKCTAYYP